MGDHGVVIIRPSAEPLPALVEVWLTGFGVSRRVPVRRYGALTEVEVGSQDRRLELVLVDPDDTLLSNTLTRLVGSTDIWSTIFSPEVRCWALPTGVSEMLTDEVLMERALDAPGEQAPTVGRVELTVDGDRAFVAVHDGDVVAARGQVSVVGPDAVFDRIGTEVAYRRRGLGTVVMAALTAWALTQGAERGLLAGSADGQALYAGLGWQAVGAMLTVAGTAPTP